MKEEAFDICEQLLSQKAHFYVCGDVKMADGVCKTLQVVTGFARTLKVLESP